MNNSDDEKSKKIIFNELVAHYSNVKQVLVPTSSDYQGQWSWEFSFEFTLNEFWVDDPELIH